MSIWLKLKLAQIRGGLAGWAAAADIGDPSGHAAHRQGGPGRRLRREASRLRLRLPEGVRGEFILILPFTS